MRIQFARVLVKYPELIQPKYTDNPVKQYEWPNVIYIGVSDTHVRLGYVLYTHSCRM